MPAININVIRTESVAEAAATSTAAWLESAWGSTADFAVVAAGDVLSPGSQAGTEVATGTAAGTEISLSYVAMQGVAIGVTLVLLARVVPRLLPRVRTTSYLVGAAAVADAVQLLALLLRSATSLSALSEDDIDNGAFAGQQPPAYCGLPGAAVDAATVVASVAVWMLRAALLAERLLADYRPVALRAQLAVAGVAGAAAVALFLRNARDAECSPASDLSVRTSFVAVDVVITLLQTALLLGLAVRGFSDRRGRLTSPPAGARSAIVDAGLQLLKLGLVADAGSGAWAVSASTVVALAAACDVGRAAAAHGVAAGGMAAAGVCVECGTDARASAAAAAAALDGGGAVGVTVTIRRRPGAGVATKLAAGTRGGEKAVEGGDACGAVLEACEVVKSHDTLLDDLELREDMDRQP